MYNTLEKLRAGEGIAGKDKQVYEDGLVGLLKDIHDRIDTAVAEAYGWPKGLSENDILKNLVALNHERAKEEARGRVRWLRPDYQNPEGRAAEAKQGKLEIAAAAKSGKAPWPKSLPDQIAAVREAPHLPARPRQVRRASAGDAGWPRYGRDDRRGPLCHLTVASSSSPRGCPTSPA